MHDIGDESDPDTNVFRFNQMVQERNKWWLRWFENIPFNRDNNQQRNNIKFYELLKIRIEEEERNISGVKKLREKEEERAEDFTLSPLSVASGKSGKRKDIKRWELFWYSGDFNSIQLCSFVNWDLDEEWFSDWWNVSKK